MVLRVSRVWTRKRVLIAVENYLSKTVKLSDLNLDLKKFRKKRESPDVPDLISYINDEQGVDYTFEPDDTLNEVRYFPARRYDALRCKKATANRRKI